MANVKSTEVLEAVRVKLEGAPEEVKSKLVDLLVTREINYRVDLLDQALAKLKDLKKELMKVHPDQEHYTSDGVKSLTYSKAKFEEKKKLEDKIEKLDTAIENAMSSPNSFTKLAETLQKS